MYKRILLFSLVLLITGCCGIRFFRSAELPITREQAHKATEWLLTNYKTQMEEAVEGTPFDVALLCAIACQETAYFWVGFIDKYTPDVILARCVLDASGDANKNRKAFPKNTKEFRKRFGDTFTDILIKEANITRKLRGDSNKQWVYKGYGIFQYDLQFVLTDDSFFREKKWYSFEECLARVMKELNAKYVQEKGDLKETIRAYNGSGCKAKQYANNVLQFREYSLEVINGQ